MEKRNSKIIDKVISSLDWDFIFEVNRCFKMGVGEGTTAIPGVKRKVFSDDLSKSDLKAELKSLLKYVIKEGLPELYYGAWMIYWADSKWVTQKYGDIEFEIEGEEGGIQIGLEVNSTLEVVYSPQRVCVVSDEVSEEIISNEDTDAKRLESMLKKALDSENYELATKIRDVIKLQKDDLPEDK
jgi:hypothetical protein